MIIYRFSSVLELRCPAVKKKMPKVVFFFQQQHLRGWKWWSPPTKGARGVGRNVSDLLSSGAAPLAGTVVSDANAGAMLLIKSRSEV